jgi:hypothetical protein
MKLFLINYPQEQILGGKKIYVHSITLRNRKEKLSIGSLFYLFLMFIEIYLIISDNVRILSIYSLLALNVLIVINGVLYEVRIYAVSVSYIFSI